MKRAVVVGGTGFIGSRVVAELLAAGWEVRVTRRERSSTMLLPRRAISLVDACLEDAEALRRAMDGCDAAFLAGAHYPRYSLDRAATVAEAVNGVRNACEAALAAGVGRLVYTSSVGALGPAPAGRPADERDVPDVMPAESVYRAAKWAMEREIERAVARGLAAVTLLPGGCLGPGDLRVGTGAFLVGVVRGALPWWVDGMVNLVDVGDVARAHVAAVSAPAGSRFCVGGHDARVGWLLAHVARRFGGHAPELELSADEARARADEDERRAAKARARVPIPREMVDLVTSGQPVSNARAEAELGVRFTPLDETLDRAHAWFARLRLVTARPTEEVR